MRSYARHSGSSTSIEVLRRDLSENSGTTLAENTVSRYLEELRQIFVIEDIPAWNPNLRSKTAIRTANTRYFSDSSIGVAALGIGPADLINDLNSFGLFFETLCMRDLKVYAESLDGGVYHYRAPNVMPLSICATGVTASYRSNSDLKKLSITVLLNSKRLQGSSTYPK